MASGHLWAQSNKRGQELDTWDTAIEKTIDVEAKAACQLPF